MQFLVQAEIDMDQTQTRTSINQYIKRGVWLCSVSLIYHEDMSPDDTVSCLYAYYSKEKHLPPEPHYCLRIFLLEEQSIGF